MLLFPSAVDVLDANSKYIIKSDQTAKLSMKGGMIFVKMKIFKNYAAYPQTVSRVYE